MAGNSIPATMKQIQVTTLGNDFRKCTELVETPVPTPGAGEVLVRMCYVGVNASDILYSSGSYKPGVPPPYTCGFEGLGEVVGLGEGAKLKVGQYVDIFQFGSYSEYIVIADHLAIPVPSLDPAYLALGVSGTTASVALEKKGELKAGETVLVTGAAGGTGQFAVQLAKLAGCHVIGTCSTDQKAQFLKSLGCDRSVVYTKESLDDVLQKEYPKGVDVVYECIGNEVFDTALQNLALNGRLIVIGHISVYEGAGRPMEKIKNQVPVSYLALKKSADIRGFFLVNHLDDVARHVQILERHYASGQIKAATDDGTGSPNGPFIGLEKVYDAIDYLYSKGNKGKIVVSLNKQ